MDILEQAAQVLHEEAQAIEQLITTLDQSFVNAVNMILACKGRVVCTGMGKSGHIGRKIAATLASTGTPALFMHPGEGVHGDLGMITEDDVVLAFSNSGETGEIIGETIQEQTEQVLKNVGAILAEAGTDFDHVIKTTCFLSDINDFVPFNEVYATAFTSDFPARSAVEVARLPKDVKIEIEVIAEID